VSGSLPPAQQAALARAVRLEWWNLGWTASIVLVIGMVLGQSQTMKTAWIEDTLGLVPPVMFLLAAYAERHWPRSARFPFGFCRVNGLGFFVAAVALVSVGALLLFDALRTLWMAEHATVGSVRLFGQDVWLGWLMLAAQLYALVPPMLIGRRELPLAERLNDKLLHTDALMNKANWLTGAAGLFGVIGLGLGWWWADSLAAAIISVDILNDGSKALRSATAELIDGAPRRLDGTAVADEVNQLHAALDRRFPGATIRIRETGRRIHAEVHGVRSPEPPLDLDALWPGAPDRAWRLQQVAFVPRARD
jgi:cobalt-zinc-cadmium efflux system protein